MKVEWEDDWPIFNDGENITIETKGREGTQLAKQSVWKADLTGDKLELGFYHKSWFGIPLSLSTRS